MIKLFCTLFILCLVFVAYFTERDVLYKVKFHDEDSFKIVTHRNEDGTHRLNELVERVHNLDKRKIKEIRKSERVHNFHKYRVTTFLLYSCVFVITVGTTLSAGFPKMSGRVNYIDYTLP